MELNWTTFLFEILNFLVLLWLLKRLFYKPLQAAIARRQAAIQRQLDEARELKDEALQLQQVYEKDLASLEQKREEARAKLQRELKIEREQQEKHLAELLQQKKQKAEVIEQRRLRDSRHQQEQEALQQGSRFATRLLQTAAGPELESRLLAVLVDGLRKIPAAQRLSLKQHCSGAGAHIDVASAFPLSPDDHNRICNALGELLDDNLPIQFNEDKSLIAGLRVCIGPWVLGANLHDELEAFIQLEDAVPSDG